MHKEQLEEVYKWMYKNQYFKHVRCYWFKKTKSGQWIRPFEMAYKHVQKLPGMWQEDRVTWYTESEYMWMCLKS